MNGILAFISFTLLLSFPSHVYTGGSDAEEKRSKRMSFYPWEKLLNENIEEWKLRFFPGESVSLPSAPLHFADRNRMFDVPIDCDDAGQTNTEIDSDESSENYTCSQKFFPVHHVPYIIHEDLIPPEYRAPHFCTDSAISYPLPLTTYGPHRPHWGTFGEYKILPRVRWLHNAEHGAVIMLYHPCADVKQVNQLREIVTKCLRRHIITPYNSLPKERPLALLTWGSYLSFSDVNPKVVREFIRDHALRGPENVSADGKFNRNLLKAAATVSDFEDSVLCPNQLR